MRNLKFKCVYCRRQLVKLPLQKVGNLPEFRLEAGVIFQNTGIDFFGPMYVKEKHSTVRVYGSLFVCMLTHAFHVERELVGDGGVELVDDLSTD